MQQVGLFSYDVDIDDDETVTDVIIIAKVSRIEGPPTVIVAHSNGSDSVTQLGLLAAAQQVSNCLGDWEERE